MKQCFKCKNIKPLNEFYKHPQMADGHLNKCKVCTRKDSQYRVDVKRLDLTWVMQERERCREKSANYRSMGKAQPPSRAVRKKWLCRNPEKRRAHSMAGNAVRNGKITKPGKCDTCNTPAEDLEMHHEDYSKPLDVKWLCFGCHGKTRRKSTL